MLQYLINVTQTVFPAVLMLVLLAFFSEFQEGSFSRRYLKRGVFAGALIALILAVFRQTTGFVIRELYNAPLLLVMLIAEALLIWRLFLYLNKKTQSVSAIRLSGILIFLLGFSWSAFYLPDLVLYVFAFREDLDCICNRTFLNRAAGYLFAFLIVFLAGLSVSRLIGRFKRKIFTRVFLLSAAIVFLWHLLLFSQIAVLRGWIPGFGWLVELVICLLHYQKVFFFGLFIVLIYVGFLAIKNNRQRPVDGADSALRRKQKIDIKRQMRWAVLLLASVLAMFLILTAGVSATNEEVEIKKPVEILPVENRVVIPIEKVSDGHLPRFGYPAEDGTEMRFIVIKKGEGSFGIGLDACDVCGPSGYYERDGQIVCALCDVVINISTIGFKGGCNPVPIEYVLKDGKIIIETAAFEAEAHRFR